jgi:hypothetical protein
MRGLRREEFDEPHADSSLQLLARTVHHCTANRSVAARTMVELMIDRELNHSIGQYTAQKAENLAWRERVKHKIRDMPNANLEHRGYSDKAGCLACDRSFCSVCDSTDLPDRGARSLLDDF